MSQIRWDEEILWIYEVLRAMPGFRKKDLALALGLEPSTVGRWDPEDGKGPPRYPNDETRDAIALLVDERDLDGWESAIARMKATIDQMERAANLRRFLIAARPERLSQLGFDHDPLREHRLNQARDLREAARRESSS